MDNVCWFGCCRPENMKEIRRLRSALEAANARIAEDTAFANGALAKAKARIAELETAGNRIGDTAINSILDGMEIHRTTLDRAERAEARIAGVEAWGNQMRDGLEEMRYEMAAQLTRSERAEAECEALRELLNWIYGHLAYVDSYHSRMIRDKVRAALNPSPKEPQA